MVTRRDRSPVRRAFGAIAVALFACVASACTTPRTELIVTVDSDIPWGPGKTVRSVAVTVRSDGPGGPVRDARVITLGPVDAGLPALPASFGVVPLGGDARRLVWIEARACADTGACDASATVTTQRAIVGFVQGQTLALRLFLADACRAVQCSDPHQTCNPATMRCESAVVDPTTLPMYSPDASTPADATDVPATGDAGTIAQITAGADFTCARNTDLTVHCWGANAKGTLGNGAASADVLVASTMTNLTDAIDIAAGAAHACAVRNDATVWCWGANSKGACGANVTGEFTAMPTAVPGVTFARQLAAGFEFTCARRDSGSVACWGQNDLGELGRGTSGSQDPTPADVTGVTDAVSIVAGDSHACALRRGGAVVCWGSNTAGQLGIGHTSAFEASPQGVGALTAIEIAAGGNSSCAILPNHTVGCWGSNVSGQLGAAGADATLPLAVPGVSNAVHLTMSSDNVCAALMDGSVECWGNNAMGEMGTGAPGPVATPTATPILANIGAVASGARHHCTLSADQSTVECWGSNTRGQLGRGVGQTDYTVPRAVPGLFSTGVVATGDDSVCATQDAQNNSVACVGYSTTPSGHFESAAMLVPNTMSTVRLSAGANHACIFRNDGTVGCWGFGLYGQLGDGMGVEEGTATFLPLGGIGAISAGGNSSCSVSPQGTQCWGSDDVGQLGDGQTGRSYVSPMNVAVLQPSVDVAVTTEHGCAVDTIGGVECWGQNDHGQIGDGTMNTAASPTAVVALPATAMRVGVGPGYSCALLSDGRVACWGDATKLGSAATSDSNVPVVVHTIVGVLELSVGPTDACARLGDATVWCWGVNTLFQIDPMLETAAEPVEVDPLRGASHIAAGSHFTCSTASDGVVRCLGVDVSGILPMAPNVFEPMPGLVIGTP